MAIKEVSTREEFDALPDGTVFYDPRHGTFREKRFNEEVGDFEAVTVKDPRREEEILQDAPPEIQQRATADREKRAVEGFPSQVTAARTRSPLRTRDRLALETVGTSNPEDAAWFLEKTDLYDVKRGPDGENFFRLKGADEWGVIDPQGWQGWDEFGLDLSHYVAKILATGTAAAKGAAVGFIRGLRGGKPGALLGTVLGGASGAASGEAVRQQIGASLGVNPPVSPEQLDPELGPVGLGEAAGDVAGATTNREVGSEALWGAVPFDLAAKGVGRAIFPTRAVKKAMREAHKAPKQLPTTGYSGVRSRQGLIDEDTRYARSEILTHGPDSAVDRVPLLRDRADVVQREGERAADYASLSHRFRQGEDLAPDDLYALAMLDEFVDKGRLVPGRSGAFLRSAEQSRHHADVVERGVDAAGRRGELASAVYRGPTSSALYGSRDAAMDAWESKHPESKEAVRGVVDEALSGVPALLARPREAHAADVPENFVMQRDPAVTPGAQSEEDVYAAALAELEAGSQVGQLPPLPDEAAAPAGDAYAQAMAIEFEQLPELEEAPRQTMEMDPISIEGERPQESRGGLNLQPISTTATPEEIERRQAMEDERLRQEAIAWEEAQKKRRGKKKPEGGIAALMAR